MITQKMFAGNPFWSYVYVLCILGIIAISTEAVTITEEVAKSDPGTFESDSPVTDCGRSKYPDAGEMHLPQPYIVGGTTVRPHEFPWQVYILLSNGAYCGGSIINDLWILTAAHCLESPVRLVAVGDHRLSTSNETERQIMFAAEVHSHPDYVSNAHLDDIGLIKLNRSITFNENLQPVCMPDVSDQYANRKSQSSGWGRQNNSGPGADYLQYATLNISTDDYCQDIYSKLSIDLSPGMMCAVDNMDNRNRSSCRGDSGGPLTVKESTGRFHIVGVVSFGLKAGCAVGYPTVYSRVGYFHEWIMSIINPPEENGATGNYFPETFIVCSLALVSAVYAQLTN